jgi:hypothetical protein
MDEVTEMIQKFKDKLYAEKSSGKSGTYKDFCIEHGFDYMQFVQAINGMRKIRADYKTAIENYISQEV